MSMSPLTPGDNKELAQSKLLIVNGLGLELMRRIKAAFPHGILNSGKVL
jgi:ABC-type Zn uptake system ZnuABC Zn-binding protein ZnuA